MTIYNVVFDYCLYSNLCLDQGVLYDWENSLLVLSGPDSQGGRLEMSSSIPFLIEDISD